jgi:hypothetical protein
MQAFGGLADGAVAGDLVDVAQCGAEHGSPGALLQLEHCAEKSLLVAQRSPA